MKKPPGWVGCSKYVSPGKRSGAHERLCDAVDLVLVEHLPGRTVEELARVQQTINARVHQEYTRALDLPVSPAGFVHFLKACHARIFEDLVPEIAGQLRDREGTFGGRGKHQRHGSSPSAIEEDLVWVFTCYQEAAKKNSDPARVMATLLQRLFEVHPFVDGNGRVGRILADAIAREHGLRFSHERSSDPKEYLRALEIAHLHCARKSDARHCTVVGTSDETRDGLKPLVLYIRSVFRSADLDDMIETPPEDDP